MVPVNVSNIDRVKPEIELSYDEDEWHKEPFDITLKLTDEFNRQDKFISPVGEEERVLKARKRLLMLH